MAASGPLRLVLGHLVDAALVALIAAEGRRDKRIDDCSRVLLRVHAGTDGDDLRVVVLARKLSGLDAPRESGANPGHPVGGQLLSIAGAADDNAERASVGPDCLGRGNAERGVVVQGVVLVSTVVRHLVTIRAQVSNKMLLELKASVVGRNMNPHTAIVPATPGANAAQMQANRTLG